MIVGSFSV